MRYAYTVLTTLLFFTSFCSAQSAQIESPCGASTIPGTATPIGVDVPAGSYEPNELILSFDQPLNDNELETLKDELADQYGGIVAEWSPSKKYARVKFKDLELSTCEILESIGEGKPLGGVEGQSQEVDLNYIGNTQGWVINDGIDCQRIPPHDFPTDEITRSVQDYTPLDDCQGPDSILPSTGSSSVRVAIIDSGVRGALSTGTIDNVAHEQTIVTRDCETEEGCRPIRPESEHLTEHVHLHGFYIFKIIANWFRNEGLEDQLTVHSYQVLNEDLTCTQFQVIKAIELASYEFKANLINLSITFEAAGCEQPRSAAQQAAQTRTALHRVIRDVEASGVIVLAAAGNSCRDLSVTPEFPAAEQGLNNLVVVGATGCNSNERASWSNYSAQHVDLLTLGERVEIKTGTCKYFLFGTSFATPIVAAKAAFHITKQASYDYQDVLCKLRSQADPHEDAIYGTVNKDIGIGNCTPKEIKDDQHFKVSDKMAAPAKGTLLVKPNPFGDEFTFELGGDLAGEGGQVTLLDFNGRLLLEQAYVGGRQTVVLTGLTPGLYLLRVVTDRGELIKRVVKQ
jgi:hypothetical protein